VKRVLNYLTLYFHPFLHFGKLVTNLNFLKELNIDILFVASPADVQTPFDETYIPDKLWGIMECAKKEQVTTLEVFHLFSQKGKFESESRFLRLELLILFRIALNPVRFFSRLKSFTQEISRLGKVTIGQRIRFLLWSHFFLDLKPVLIFGVGMDEILIASARFHNVKTIEVMHGLFMQGKSPFASRVEGKFAKPDLFLTWHDAYTSIVIGLGVASKTLGYPNSISEELNVNMKSDKDKNILVTLSWGVNDSADPSGTTTWEVYKSLHSLRSTNLKFRIHPVICQNKRRLSRIIRWLSYEFPGCQISIPYDESLMVALMNCSLHITDHSSTFFEASLLGIPTLVLNKKGSDILYIPDELLESGLVFFEESFLENYQFRNLLNAQESFFRAAFKEEVILEILRDSKLVV
jgi:hypothetical protein